MIHPHLSDEFQRVDRPFRTRGTRVLQIGTAYNKNIERLAQAMVGLDVELRVIGEMSPSQRAAVTAAKIKCTERTGLSRKEILDEYVNADIVATGVDLRGLRVADRRGAGRWEAGHHEPLRIDAGGLWRCRMSCRSNRQR